MKRIESIIERGPDGLYSARTEARIGKHYPSGYGDDAAEARGDFMQALKESCECEGVDVSDFAIRFTYDLPSLFSDFEAVNISALAREAGINESKMRQYACGAAYPSEKTTARILDTVHQLGARLCAVSL